MKFAKILLVLAIVLKIVVYILNYNSISSIDILLLLLETFVTYRLVIVTDLSYSIFILVYGLINIVLFAINGTNDLDISIPGLLQVIAGIIMLRLKAHSK